MSVVAHVRPAPRPAGGARADGAPAQHAPAHDVGARLRTAVAARSIRPGPGPGPAPYGVAAYLAAAALRPDPAAEALEVTHRRTADGARLTVARRVAGGRTVGLEAQVG